jgi:hypothetical protein
MSSTPSAPEVEVLLEGSFEAECQRPGVLRFRVQDAETGKPIPGLRPRLRYHRAADDLTLERRNFVEETPGVYAFPFRPSIRGAHGILFGAQVGDREITEVFGVFATPTRETTTQGGATYRVGAEWQPGHIHSHPSDKVRLLFEIDRLHDGGKESPVAAEDVEVVVTASERGVNDRIKASATGPGRFEAQRAFTLEEVGNREVPYTISLTFRDPATGARVPEGSITFPLAAGPTH